MNEMEKHGMVSMDYKFFTRFA